MKLLTLGNYKTMKGEALGYRTLTLNLEPNYVDAISGERTCPFAGECVKYCLSKCGRNKYDAARKARLRRTELFFAYRSEFLAQLYLELAGFGKQKKFKVAVRLNALSDIAWEEIDLSLFDRFPNIQFYDYTKSLERALNFCEQGFPFPLNYHLTYSLNENSIENVAQILANAYSALARFGGRGGCNTAVVFKGELPKEFHGLPVVNGDEHDLRFLDPKGVVVGLKFKQPYRMNTGYRVRVKESGFVVGVEKV